MSLPELPAVPQDNDDEAALFVAEVLRSTGMSWHDLEAGGLRIVWKGGGVQGDGDHALRIVRLPEEAPSAFDVCLHSEEDAFKVTPLVAFVCMLVPQDWFEVIFVHCVDGGRAVGCSWSAGDRRDSSAVRCVRFLALWPRALTAGEHLVPYLRFDGRRAYKQGAR